MYKYNSLLSAFFFLSNIFTFSGSSACVYVESSPGPTFNIEKSIIGSFHQGGTRFGLTTGTQSACNSLYALCWSHMKKVSRWKTHDLDHILDAGNVLYKSLETMDLLSADELPRSIMMSNNRIRVFSKLK